MWIKGKSGDYLKGLPIDITKEKCVYAIELESSKKVIGGIGLHKRQPDKTLGNLDQREIGYVLNPKYWGNGFVPEATKALVQYGFESLNLDLI